MVALVEDLESENNDQQITSSLDPRIVIATDVNGNLHFIDVDGLGYHYQGTTLTILDPASPGSEPRVIENVRKLILTDSQGHEIDPYDL